MSQRHRAGNRVQVPFLPGYQFVDPRAQARPLPQLLKYVSGYQCVYDQEEIRSKSRTRPQSAHPRMMSSEAPPGEDTYAGEPMSEGGPPVCPPGCAPTFQHSAERQEYQPPSAASRSGAVASRARPTTAVPAWLAYDRQVLRFYGFFREPVVERREENWRVRKCIIYFYLEDGSIQVSEPKEDNSGLPQGVFLKRHRVPYPGGLRNGYISVEDLCVGGEVEMYARRFFICACDAFTRKFLDREGFDVPDDIPFPDGPIKEYKQTLMKQPKKKVYDDTTRKFFENDRKVLRFFLLWDDRGSLYGDRRPFILHYYLVDDTIEVLEQHDRNDGRDPFPKLLNRMKLPKHVYSVGTRPMTASQRTRCNWEYYTYDDLKVGCYVNVYGRRMLIHDADEFTRHYYVTKLNWDIQDFRPVVVAEQYPPIPQSELPPYNGWGTEEDSRQNCLSLIPRAKEPDFHKFMAHDRQILRFTARMGEDSSHRIYSNTDRQREFVINCFLVDDTLSIFEPPLRNSGVQGGKFLERCEVKKPGGRVKLGPRDLYVGAKIEVHSRIFELHGADDYTLAYMEANADSWPMSDGARVLEGVARAVGSQEGAAEALAGFFIALDKDGSGRLSEGELRGLLGQVGVELSMQEVITLKRRIDPDGNGISFSEFMGSIGAGES